MTANYLLSMACSGGSVGLALVLMWAAGKKQPEGTAIRFFLPAAVLALVAIAQAILAVAVALMQRSP